MVVVIGCLPFGISFNTDTSRSPNTVSCKDRGIGVAVIVSRCGALSLGDFNINFCLCSTPNRCCSSIITSDKSWNTVSSVRSACVPITRSISPAAIFSFSSGFFLVAPVKRATFTPSGVRIFDKFS